MIQVEVHSLDELDKVCHALADFVTENKVIAFHGEMGAGKTTFIKKFIQHLGGTDSDSPTFALVNECPINDNEMAYHFDFYRIESEEEAFDMGFEEYLYSGNYCFIEWPERILNLLPNNYVKVCIEEKNKTRLFTIESTE